MLYQIKGGLIHPKGGLVHKKKRSSNASALSRHSDLKTLKAVLAGVHISKSPTGQKKKVGKKIVF